MLLKFENGLMIIEHESGHISTYSKEYLQKILIEDEQNLTEAQQTVDETKNFITKIELSVGG